MCNLMKTRVCLGRDRLTAYIVSFLFYCNLNPKELGRSSLICIKEVKKSKVGRVIMIETLINKGIIFKKQKKRKPYNWLYVLFKK